MDFGSGRTPEPTAHADKKKLRAHDTAPRGFCYCAHKKAEPLARP